MIVWYVCALFNVFLMTIAYSVTSFSVNILEVSFQILLPLSHSMNVKWKIGEHLMVSKSGEYG